MENSASTERYDLDEIDPCNIEHFVQDLTLTDSFSTSQGKKNWLCLKFTTSSVMRYLQLCFAWWIWRWKIQLWRKFLISPSVADKHFYNKGWISVLLGGNFNQNTFELLIVRAGHLRKTSSLGTLSQILSLFKRCLYVCYAILRMRLLELYYIFRPYECLIHLWINRVFVLNCDADFRAFSRRAIFFNSRTVLSAWSLNWLALIL